MQAYLSKEIYPFHMPGHKGNPMFIPQGLAKLDLTEIPGMDVLHKPTGIIGQLQESIADFYGADESHLLVNGSTAGIVSAISALCGEGRRIYAARNGHVSMYNGIALSGAVPIYLVPEKTPDGLTGGIKPELLDNMEEGAVVFIVSPTYEGFVSDIKEIAARVHSCGGVLIVDEAHGAHFKFSDTFPVSALDLGADIVVQSFHKTLPALGQMAVLHVKGTRIDRHRLRYFLQVLQTSSPSYMLMGQLDYILQMLWKRPEIFEAYVSRLKGLRMALANSDGLAIILSGRERVGQCGIYDIDPGKLLFNTNTEYKAEFIAEKLASQYRIQIEMAYREHLLAMTTVADTDEGMQRLWGAIGSLNIKMEDIHYEPENHIRTPRKLPEMVLTPGQAMGQEAEVVPWKMALGRISGEMLVVLPPGIPMVVPGERIPKGLMKLAPEVRVLK